MSPKSIIVLKKGETVAMKQLAWRSNSDDEPHCNQPRFTAQGRRIQAGNVKSSNLANTDVYQAAARVSFPEDYIRIQTTTEIVVPPEPENIYKQIMYSATGLHDANDTKGALIQSVLSWNQEGKGLKWTASVWYLHYEDECAYSSTPVSVAVGDRLAHTIEATQANNKHTIYASIIDRTTNTTIVQDTFSPTNFTPNEVVNIGFESYYVLKCNLMPAGGAINYPYIETSLTTASGTSDISNQISIDPLPEQKCSPVLQLDPPQASASRKSR